MTDPTNIPPVGGSTPTPEEPTTPEQWSREFEAMWPAFEAMLPLDPEARARAMRWLLAKLADEEGASDV